MNLNIEKIFRKKENKYFKKGKKIYKFLIISFMFKLSIKYFKL